jgi:hypothetical protein
MQEHPNSDHTAAPRHEFVGVENVELKAPRIQHTGTRWTIQSGSNSNHFSPRRKLLVTQWTLDLEGIYSQHAVPSEKIPAGTENRTPQPVTIVKWAARRYRFFLIKMYTSRHHNSTEGYKNFSTQNAKWVTILHHDFLLHVC